MRRRRHTPEQTIRKLREADRLLAEGAEVPDVAKALRRQLAAKRTNQSTTLIGRGPMRGPVIPPEAIALLQLVIP